MKDEYYTNLVKRCFSRFLGVNLVSSEQREVNTNKENEPQNLKIRQRDEHRSPQRFTGHLEIKESGKERTPELKDT